MNRLFFVAIVFSLNLSKLGGQDDPYIPGEKVSYVIHYGMITGGIASLELIRDTLSGRNVWYSKALGQTTGVADALFRMKDIYSCYIDPVTALPIKSIRNIREGHYRKYNEVIFDHKTRIDSTILFSDLTGKHIAPPRLHDIMSCFYYFRKNILPEYNSFKKGDLFTIMTWFTDTLYPIRLRYVNTEEIRTKVGKIRCLKFNPVTETGRLFKTEEDMSVWFSADKNFLPVKIRIDIFVGSLTIEITSFEGLANKLETR
jgi:hypothetical protein